MSVEHVECELSEDRQVFWAIVLSIAGAVLVEGDVEDPMPAVLDRTVSPCPRHIDFGGQRPRRQVVVPRDAGFARRA